MLPQSSLWCQQLVFRRLPDSCQLKPIAGRGAVTLLPAVAAVRLAGPLRVLPRL
jgi:hypothetical protein